jgi:hypothetical protein
VTPLDLAWVIQQLGGYTSASRQLAYNHVSLRNYVNENYRIPQKLIDRIIELQKAGFRTVERPYKFRMNSGKCHVKISVAGEVVFESKAEVASIPADEITSEPV